MVGSQRYILVMAREMLTVAKFTVNGNSVDSIVGVGESLIWYRKVCFPVENLRMLLWMLKIVLL